MNLKWHFILSTENLFIARQGFPFRANLLIERFAPPLISVCSDGNLARIVSLAFVLYERGSEGVGTMNGDLDDVCLSGGRNVNHL